MQNREVEVVLEQIAQILELKGTNTFKVRAYQNAARAVGSLDEDITVLVEEKRLSKVRGIGKSIQTKLTELIETGELRYLDEIREGIPDGLFEMLRVPGMGPKKTRVLWEELKVTDLASLEAACKDGSVAKLKGFGKKSQEKILDGITHLAETAGRRIRSQVLPFADELVAYLREHDAVERIDVAGSLRRGRETVKDVDILVASQDAPAVMEAMLAYDGVDSVIGSGGTKTSVRLKGGLQVDVRVVKPESFACALAYFTGSKDFNIALRQLALELGYSLNEYFLLPRDGTKPPEIPTEEALHNTLGLAYIEPHLRENTGEIAAAKDRKLPTLIEAEDIQGILHVHTKWSDGAQTVEDMVAQAEALGYAYLGISDHSQAAEYANGLTAERVRAQVEEIEAARAKHPKIRVFHGIEADILSDGAIDLPDDLLESLDFVIASVHMHLGMERSKMTQRLVKALSHPAVRVLGHPLGRKLLQRGTSQFDWEPVLDAALEHGVAIEVNGHPRRLDADWVHIRRIRARGVKLCLNPDAHSMNALDDARTYAVVEARRGWTSASDVVNTMPLKQFEEEFLRRG